MNSRERVLAALNRLQPDRVPLFDEIDAPVLLGLVQLLGLAEPDTAAAVPFPAQELLCRVAVGAGLDAAAVSASTGQHAVAENRVGDIFGCVFIPSPLGEAVITAGPVQSQSDLRGFDMASRLLPEHFDQVRYARERLGPERALFLAISDPFKLAWSVRGGMEKLLVDFVEDPQLVLALTRLATDYNLALIDLAASHAGTVDVVFMGGDLADERTTIMSPRHFRRFVKPFEKEIVEAAHRAGLKAIKHTDGNVWPILDDFADIGFDAYHPIQPQCMDIGETKRHLAGRMALMGNIDCRAVLCDYPPEAVEAVVIETIAKAAPGGGYILSSSNSLHAGVRPENALAMFRATQRYGVYGPDGVVAAAVAASESDAPQ
jgi:uroporphyrinogen decarboxylase